MAIGECVGVEGYGFGADTGAAGFIDVEGDLGSGGGGDRAITQDPRAVRLQAGLVGREFLGLSERHYAQHHRQQAGKKKPAVDPNTVSRQIQLHKISPPESNWLTYAVAT